MRRRGGDGPVEFVFIFAGAAKFLRNQVEIDGSDD